jgi:hypothetical protein
VYIQEAHADDSWPIGTEECFAIPRQHATLQDRLAAIAKLKTSLPSLANLPTYADSMHNDFQTLYGAWPTRFYLFQGCSLALQADASGDAHFDFCGFMQRAVEMSGVDRDRDRGRGSDSDE